MKVVERLLLDGIRRQRGNRAVDQRQQLSIAMLPGATPTKSARRQQAAALANVAPDLSARSVVEQRLAEKDVFRSFRENVGGTSLRRCRGPTIHDEASLPPSIGSLRQLGLGGEGTHVGNRRQTVSRERSFVDPSCALVIVTGHE